MFDFIFKRKTKKLDSSLFFQYASNEDELKVLQSQGNDEFKEALLSVMEKKLAENVWALTHGHVKGDEERGVYLGTIRVYEDLINWFKKKSKQNQSVYEDPYNKKAVT